MRVHKLILVILICLGLAFAHKYSQLNRSGGQINKEITEVAKNTPGDEECTPAFSDGGGPYYYPNSPFRENITPEDNEGDELLVEGKILYNDCKTPVANAMLDIWQANESGSYEDDWYRGRVRSDHDGVYFFRTVIPKGYGSGTGFRPPHIHFKVWKDGVELVTSQMFFPEAEGRPGFDGAYIMDLEEQGLEAEVKFRGYHDIVLPIRSY